MKVLEINIYTDSEEALILEALKELESKFNMKVKPSFKRSLALPGEPMTVKELNDQIDKSEKSKLYSFEEAKVYFDV